MNPAWISAIASTVTSFGSLAAFGTAVWAGRAAWRQVEHVQEEQRKKDDREEQARASKFAAWLELQFDDSRNGFTIFQCCMNAGDLPVYSLNFAPNAERQSWNFTPIVPPLPHVQKDPLVDLTNRVRRCAEEVTASLKYKGVVDVDDIAKSLAQSVVKRGADFSFGDTEGTDWLRASTGLLTRGRLSGMGHEGQSELYEIASLLAEVTLATKLMLDKYLGSTNEN